MTSEWITDEQITYFKARYPKTWKHSLGMAERNANEYASKHAPKAVRYQVAALHLAYGMQTDAGDKKLIRRAIDEAIAYGEYCDAQAKS